MVESRPSLVETVNATVGSTYRRSDLRAAMTNVNNLDSIAKKDAAAVPYRTYGTMPRNSLRGPGDINLDLAIAKHFRIGERLDVELRGDAFNVLNHTQFSNPSTNISSPSFGQISTTIGDPSAAGYQAGRILQLALHLKF